MIVYKKLVINPTEGISHLRQIQIQQGENKHVDRLLARIAKAHDQPNTHSRDQSVDPTTRLQQVCFI